MQQSFVSQSSRPTPSTSPFRPQPMMESTSRPPPVSGGGSNATLMSRLRAGSMPQRPGALGTSTPFGPSLFSTNWSSGRERANTLASIRSSEGPTSPTQSSRDGLADADVRTLDYLGLAETPQQSRAQLAGSHVDMLMHQQQQQQQQQQHHQQQQSSLPPLLAELAMLNKNANRFRSYSVNAKEKYAEDDDEQYGAHYNMPSGTMTPSAAATAAQLAATQAQIHQHNLAVQAFANHASASRPRARTAGVLDTPPQRSSIRNYLATPSKLDSSMTAADVHIPETGEYDELADAVQMMHLGGIGSMHPGQEIADENNLEGPTRALWIGSIPVSTTVTSLDAIFSMYGKIDSTRVLTHKNCGFVNFDRVESAIQAKSLLNGKEIFPGAGPVRIGYAKVPTSPSETPGHTGSQTSPRPGLSTRTTEDEKPGGQRDESIVPQVPPLADLQSEMAQIVAEFGASETECHNISMSIQRSVTYRAFVDEIPPVPEPSQARAYDAPRLRDIRKRIDNGACSVEEIEATAMDMLPEIAELSSDYLGNTVVQKLFEYCSEDIKEQMLVPITPHLAEIGIHKNGTWAAQKIIDVAKSSDQKQMVVENLRPYTVPLFLDQYGNYVLQGCLRFGSPFNDFIFETMLSRMWEVSQGRFGSRAMRACLESHHATKDQQRMLAAAIALHSVQLATSANGALLLTWYLDTCTFPHRRTVLAPRLVPHLVHLCTHKVAYLTVLKIVNQRNEPDARDIILKALFFNGDVLEDILRDPSSGATLIFKVLTTPFFEESMRNEVIKTVAKVLTKLKTTPSQGYKRLMDEVGLSSRGAGRDRDQHHDRHQQRQAARQTNNSNSNYAPQPSAQLPPGQPFDTPVNMPRTGSADQGVHYDPYALNAAGLAGLNPLGAPGFPQEQLAPLTHQQLQYQAYLAAQSRGGVPTPYYPSMGHNAFAGFAPPPQVQPHASPLPGPAAPIAPNPMMQMQQPAYAPQQFAPAMNAQMYNSYPQQFYPQQPQGMPPNGRRGHVSL